jgi:hypothetical protein
MVEIEEVQLTSSSTDPQLAIGYTEWREKAKPDGISACIRLRNESQFMRAAVRSIVDLVDEVVLVVQPGEDDTLQIDFELELQYEKVRVCYYPLVPDWIDTPAFYSKDPDAPGHMVHMSNWALSQCRYSWILKVEGDVIALPTLKGMLQHVRANIDVPHYYGFVILNVAGSKMDQISWENPRNGGWDEAIFPNNPDIVRFHRRNKWEVAVPTCDSTCLGWALLHMKRCKTGKDQAWNGEHYVPWNPDVVMEALKNYAGNNYPGPDDPFGRHVLFGEEWKAYL